jgi:hypothetical protein
MPLDLPDPIGLRLIQPGRQNLEAFARHRRLKPDSDVNVMLPAGSNSQYSAKLAALLLGALHNNCRDAAMRVIARVDVGRTPAAANVRPQDTALLDSIVAQMNADPSAHADETLQEFPWLQQVRRYCADRGREMVLLTQRATNSRIEAERAVCPPETERGIVGTPTHVVQVAHVGSLARRQRLGLEDGLKKDGALKLDRKNVVVVASSTVPPPANPAMENPAETISYLAALLEDWGIPLAELRRALSSFKGWLSPVRKD